MTRQPDSDDELHEQLAHADRLIEQQRAEIEQLYQDLFVRSCEIQALRARVRDLEALLAGEVGWP